MFDRNYSRGYDMRRNLEIAQKTKKYVTDVFTDEAVNLIKNHDGNEPLFMMLMHLAPHTGNEDNPMEAPDEIIEKFNHIKSEKRRKLAAMISVMDVGIGKVVKAIKDKGILENTIVMFLSGNNFRNLINFEIVELFFPYIIQIMEVQQLVYIRMKLQTIL